MEGTSQLAEWLPNVVIAQLQQGADLPSAGVADAVGVAVTATVFMVIVQMTGAVLRGLRNAMAGRSLVVRADGFLGGLRRLAALAVVAIPWYHVARIPIEGVLTTHATDQALLAGLAWLVLGAVDHKALWLDLREGVVRARRGFAVFRRHDLVLNLNQVFRTAGGRPVGNLAQLGDRRVSIDAAAISALAAFQGGDEQARRYLEAVVVKAGGRVTR